ncbi:hypothetical protein LTR56_021723 [Elasticomyces elasticus]|nr:hypothetical protein LTR56_021723 [Elasticomyces elasticus]KAK3630625.1 hypothetical protein LTR22_021427 [Elasticomyces elasticus]KAK4909155.1 hypothetical protein LTR49_022054 [Elasticomyces elasticus]KAK5749209.1 hypothetical protein LTS12_020720 [Elasticomyces elasticus]
MTPLATSSGFCKCHKYISKKRCLAAQMERAALFPMSPPDQHYLIQKLQLEDAHPNFKPYAADAAHFGLSIEDVAQAIKLRKENGEYSDDPREIERALLQVKQERTRRIVSKAETRERQPTELAPVISPPAYSWPNVSMTVMESGDESSTSATSETSTLDHELEPISGSSQRRRGAGSDPRSRDDGCKDGTEVGRTEPLSVIYPMQILWPGTAQDHQVVRQVSTEETAMYDMAALARAREARQARKRKHSSGDDEDHRPVQRSRVPWLEQYTPSTLGTPREPTPMTGDVDADDGYHSRSFAMGFRNSRLAPMRNIRSSRVNSDVNGNIDPKTGTDDDSG